MIRPGFTIQLWSHVQWHPTPAPYSYLTLLLISLVLVRACCCCTCWVLLSRHPSHGSPYKTHPSAVSPLTAYQPSDEQAAVLAASSPTHHWPHCMGTCQAGSCVLEVVHPHCCDLEPHHGGHTWASTARVAGIANWHGHHNKICWK
jgi:hypothetical protein